MEETYLIVGLGNPGKGYADTRHNVGFMVLDRLAKRQGAGWEVNKKFEAHLAKARQESNTVFLCKPQGYMNLSGQSVVPLAKFYQIPFGQIMVVVDDLDLPLGAIRMRPGGGTGGHRGLDSIQGLLGKDDFARLRLGIGRPEPDRDVSGFVLGKFAEAETGLLERVLETAADQLACWMLQGTQQAMNNYNGDYSPTGKKTDDEIRRDDHPEGNRT
ncbi:MAG: aminoacyl-tRNA hydrolase [Verrucomicrobiota bacterium]|jgi:PTH1 family peptidyl-tRNA hydrolase|nr:aminoacyl-tRNA hydrolase [Verrucomicrobiota bacterium]|tara:strand:+ start:1350 stop:1994 length:645 start_codon:yes stop_codon:yes gene_type:complete